MAAGLEVTSAPAVEPVSRTNMKLYLKVDDTADDDLIDSLIVAARQAAEKYTRRAFITQTITLTLDQFPDAPGEQWWDGMRETAISELHRSADYIVLPRPPVQSIASVKTYNDANAESTFSSSNYTFNTGQAKLFLNAGQSWPTDLRNHAAVAIAYVAGYGDASTDVPDAIITAIKQHVSAMYEARTVCEMPDLCKALLDPYRNYDNSIMRT